MSGPCGECARWTLEGVPDRMVAAGFGKCVLLRAWHLQGRTAACAFEPVRFVARPAPAARVQPAPCDLPEEIDFG